MRLPSRDSSMTRSHWPVTEVVRPRERPRRVLIKRDDMVAAPVGRVREQRGRLQARERTARRVGRDHLDQRRTVVSRNLGPHLPVQRILGLGCGDIATESEAGLIGILGLDAAEGRNRGPDHDGVDTGDDREEAEQADQHRAAGQFAWAAFVVVDRAVCRHRRPHGPRKWSTAVACRPVLGSVMRNVSGIEAAGGSG